MGPYSSRQPDIDITPQRIGPVDIVSLDNVEVRAVLVHLAGHRDPVVSTAVVEAVQGVLSRTRVSGEPE
jgi:hypothetical protein